MAVVQLSDVIVPEYFAEYMANNSMVSTALFQSGVLVGNSLMQAQLGMGGDLLNIPAWNDLSSPADYHPPPQLCHVFLRTGATTFPRLYEIPGD